MSENTDPKLNSRTVLFALVALCCLALVFWLRFYGVVLSIPILLMAVFLIRNRHDAPETDALRSSISLSAEDITTVLEDYEYFAESPETDAVADRTLQRPALADKDCTQPDIEDFHFQCHTNRRFLSRLQARLSGELSVAELEQLLNVTDRRALELKESWLLARRSAKRLGTEY